MFKKNTIIIAISLVAIMLSTGCGKKIPMTVLGDKNFETKDYPMSMDGANNLAFAYAQPIINVDVELSTELRNALGPRLKYMTKQLKCHLNSELDKVIQSKGFTITGKYRSYNYMTFTEKRNTSALFYPEIKLTIRERSEMQANKSGKPFSKWVYSTEGDLEIEAEVNIIMLEPLSNERIWIKSIPVESAVAENFRYINAYRADVRTGKLYGAGVKRGQTTAVPGNVGTIALKLDQVYKEIDAKIIEATQRYIETDELSFLNTDIKKLKKIKRY